MPSSVQRLAGVPRRAASLLASGTERLRQLLDLARRSEVLGEEAARRSSSIEKKVARVDKELRAVRSELRALKRELHNRMLQYHLQLGRLARQAGESGITGEPRLSGRPVPLALDGASAPEWGAVGDGPAPDPEGREWLVLDACPMCGSAERTVVNEFNKLILLSKAPDREAPRYDYAVCHACGVLYASRRPHGSRFRFLLENFGEVTAKTGGGRDIENKLLNPYPLSPEDREQLQRIVRRGVFVSEHLELQDDEYLEGLQKDRFENSVHVDLLGTLLEPRGARVLELRPRTGAISDSLRRLYGADVRTLPIWESQQFLIQTLYGIDAAALIDFDRFEVPYPGPFDLIIANHILTHIVRPVEFFAVIRGCLAPGGHVYFYNEPDDAEYLRGRQSMIATLNPLHMQAFDRRSLQRALAASGFDVVFHRRRRLNHMCLAKWTDPAWSPMDEIERQRRIKAYRRARDRAILGVREEIRGRFAEQWPGVVERAVAEGVAEFDANGRLRLVAK